MLRKALLAALAGMVVAGPTVVLLAVAVLMNPATSAVGAGCVPVPGQATGRLADDASVPARARAWITKAARTCPDLPETWIAAVMAQESSFRPDAFAFDVNGGTWGLFQINEHIWRTVYGDWDTDRNGNGVWDIREPDIHAEYGARYLCDLLADIRATRTAHPDWPSTRELTELEALVIAHNAGPGRLATHPDIPTITRHYLDTVRQRMRDWAALPGDQPSDPSIPETGQVVMPLPAGAYTITSGYGMREDPIRPGTYRMHHGVDLAAPDGIPILAVADGVVVRAEMAAGRTGTIAVEHTIRGQKVATVYLHMWEHGIHVTPGQQVSAGQHIGAVGSHGNSTGPHLHLEVHPGGADHLSVDPEVWLAKHAASHLDVPTDTAAPGCAPTRQPSSNALVAIPGFPITAARAKRSIRSGWWNRGRNARTCPDTGSSDHRKAPACWPGTGQSSG